MVELTKEELLDVFKEMTLVELSEFVKLFEETSDVTAAAPVTVAQAAASAAGGGDETAEEADFGKVDVILTSGGDEKVTVVKEVRALISLGLEEARDLVGFVPKPILEQVGKDVAEKVKATLEVAGGSVELR